jgi:hypothetical protein
MGGEWVGRYPESKRRAQTPRLDRPATEES